jgi:hypothetical protein
MGHPPMRDNFNIFGGPSLPITSGAPSLTGFCETGPINSGQRCTKYSQQDHEERLIHHQWIYVENCVTGQER